MTEIYAMLLTAHSDVLTRLGTWKGGLAVVIGTFMAGVGTALTIAEVGSHETRITAAEVWIEAHDETVTAPRVAQLDQLAIRQTATDATLEEIMRRLDSIETLLWCSLNAIPACPATSPTPPTRRTP